MGESCRSKRGLGLDGYGKTAGFPNESWGEVEATLRFEIRADNKRFRESDCSLDHFASRVAFAKTPLLERSLAVWHVLSASLVMQCAFLAWVGYCMMALRPTNS